MIEPAVVIDCGSHRGDHCDPERDPAEDHDWALVRLGAPGVIRGIVVDTLPQFHAGVLKATVRGHTGLTPYARVGNWSVVLLALAVVLAAHWLARSRQ